MAEDLLTMRARVIDAATPALRKIRSELGDIRQTQGMTQASKWMGEFNDRANAFAKSGGSVSGVMGSIGLGSLTAAASLGGLIAQFKALGDHTFAMKRLGEETKMTVDQINRWEYVGKVFHVPEEQMDQALKTFGDQMRQFAKRRGELFGELNQLDPAEAAKLLGMPDANQQFQEILNWIGKLKSGADQNAWAREFFGTDVVGNLLTNGLPAFNKAVTDAKTEVAATTPELQAQADLLNKSIIAFDQSWKNLKTDVAPAIFKDLRQATDEMKATFDDIKGVVEWAQKNKGDIGKAIGSAGDAWLDQQEKINEARRKAGNGPIIDIPGAAIETKKVLQGRSVPSQETTDAHKKFLQDRRNLNPLFNKPSDPYGGLSRDSFGDLGHKTSFNGGSQGLLNLADYRGGSDDPVESGTKAGVLAAFREWAQQNSPTKVSGTGADIMQASWEEGGIGGRLGLGDAGRHGRGGRRGSGKSPGIDGDPVDPGGSAAGNLTKLIEEASKNAGIDPRIMEGIRAGESGHGRNYDKKDDAIESSWGPFQLNRRRGLGVQFEHETGLDVRDPRTIPAQARWVANYIKKGGSLHAWMGYHGPRNADPRWGDSGYHPTETETETARSGAPSLPSFKLPPGGSWAHDSKGNPVAVDADGRAITPDGRPTLVQRPSLMDKPKNSDDDRAPIRGSIDAHIHVHGPASKVTAKSTGDVGHVHLRRGPTMTQPNYEA